MKKYLPVILILFATISAKSQKQFSIGAYASGYTKVDPIEPFINIIPYYNAQSLRINTSCYGLSAQWFPKWINAEGSKNALYAEYLQVDHEYLLREEFEGKGANGQRYWHRVIQHTYKNNGYTLGYKHFEPLGRFNLFMGAGYTYFHYNPTQYRDVFYIFNDKKEYVGYQGNFSELPGGSARGLALSGGFDFFITKNKGLSLGLSAAISFLQVSVAGTTSNVSKQDWWDTYQWVVIENGTAGSVNSKQNFVTSPVASAHLKYYFNVKLPKWMKFKKQES